MAGRAALAARRRRDHRMGRLGSRAHCDCRNARTWSHTITPTTSCRARTTLLALPGIGDYTASAVMSFRFRRRIAVVDTNIRRVL